MLLFLCFNWQLLILKKIWAGLYLHSLVNVTTNASCDSTGAFSGFTLLDPTCEFHFRNLWARVKVFNPGSFNCSRAFRCHLVCPSFWQRPTRWIQTNGFSTHILGTIFVCSHVYNLTTCCTFETFSNRLFLLQHLYTIYWYFHFLFHYNRMYSSGIVLHNFFKFSSLVSIWKIINRFCFANWILFWSGGSTRLRWTNCFLFWPTIIFETCFPTVTSSSMSNLHNSMAPCSHSSSDNRFLFLSLLSPSSFHAWIYGYLLSLHLHHFLPFRADFLNHRQRNLDSYCLLYCHSVTTHP